MGYGPITGNNDVGPEGGVPNDNVVPSSADQHNVNEGWVAVSGITMDCHFFEGHGEDLRWKSMHLT
jgi:hypothetical protein